MIYRGFIVFFTVLVLLTSPVTAGMVDHPIVKIQALDKSTARTVTFEAKVGTTVEYGSLFIKVQSCRKSDPLDKPESAAFLQIWEVPLNSDKSEWAFSGWMFASSPALSAMDHAVYDVWVLDCLSTANKNKKAKLSEQIDKVADSEKLEEAIETTAIEEEILDSEANITPTPEINAVIPEDEDAVTDENAESESDAFVIPSLNIPSVTNQSIENTIDSVLDRAKNQ